MTWKNVQLPLSSDEVRQILENSSEDAVLVGGQALALWSQIYHLLPPKELTGGISADIDFITSVSTAKIVGQALNRSGGGWKLHEVDPGDATPQTAKLSLDGPLWRTRAHGYRRSPAECSGGGKEGEGYRSLVGPTTRRGPHGHPAHNIT